MLVKGSASERHKKTVDELVELCTQRGGSYKDVARGQPPIIALLTYQRLHGLGQSELGERIGFPRRPDVSDLLNGKRVPNSHQRVVIERVCSIPVGNWTSL